MTTVAELRDDMIRWRDVDRQDRMIESEKNQKAHGKIEVKLDTMNGTQREHSVTLAEVATEQVHHCKRLDKGDKERGALFSLTRKLDKSVAMKWGYAAGAAAAVLGILQYVIQPILKHIAGG